MAGANPSPSGGIHLSGIGGDVLLQAAGDIVAGNKQIILNIANLFQAGGPPAADLAASLASPSMTDLVEILRDPAEVPAAIFRSVARRELAPYDIPYVEGREGFTSFQAELHAELLRSGGALLLLSRAGLGKTREISDLATRLCATEGWTVCVAKGAGDALMNRPDGLPDELRGSRLLFIIDDLHLRVAGKGGRVPYASRLDAFLRFFEEVLLPDEMYVIASARSEPQYRSHLTLDAPDGLGRRFHTYELPEFTTEGLAALLSALSAATAVEVEETDIPRMVANSDRTLRTIVMNMEQAGREARRLSREGWKPTQRQSWEQRFQFARAKWPVAERIYESLHLVRAVGIQPRIEYVSDLASRLAGEPAEAAARGLLDMGLLSWRLGILDAFGDEQRTEILRSVGKELPELAPHLASVVAAIEEQVRSHADWAYDLIPLAQQLLIAGRDTDAERSMDCALTQGVLDKQAYLARGIARYQQRNFAGAEQDLTEALPRGGAYFVRGQAREALENFAGAEEDYTAAVDSGQQGHKIYLRRGVVRFRLGRFPEAEQDLVRSLESGDGTAEIHAYLGIIYGMQGRYADAEAHFGQSLVREYSSPIAMGRAFSRQMSGDLEGAGREYSEVIARREELGVSALVAYAFEQRGLIRMGSGDTAGAIADFSSALAEDPDTASVYLARANARTTMRDYAGAEEDITAAMARGVDHELYYAVRGELRTSQNKSKEAEQDFTEAIARGRDSAATYYNRGCVRLLREDPDLEGAEQDFTAAITRGRDDQLVYNLRGRARLRREDWPGAEQDFTAAIARGADGADTYEMRSLARYGQRNASGVEEDCTAAIDRGLETPPVCMRRAIVRAIQGKHAEAEEDVTAAMNLGARDEHTFCMRGELRGRQGRYAEAEQDLSEAIARGRDDAQVYRLRSLARFNQDEMEAAEQDASAAIERDGGDERLYRLRAGIRGRLGRRDAMVADLGAAAAIEKLDADALTRLGYQLRTCARYPEALAVFEFADEAGCVNIHTFVGWGSILRHLERYEEAASVYERALRLDASHAFVHACLAACYQVLGRPADQQRHAGIAQSLAPEWSFINDYDRACFEALCGNTREALALLKTVVETGGESLEYIRVDPDLEFIRHEPEYQRLVSLEDG